MAPNVLSILGTAYTGPDRVRAISVYGMVMGPWSVAEMAALLLGVAAFTFLIPKKAG
jgi:hypothetical protein